MIDFDELVLKHIKTVADNLKTKMDYETSVVVSETGRPIEITLGEPEVTLESIQIPISYGSESDKEMYEEEIYPNALKR